jgi:hypothetical protein
MMVTDAGRLAFAAAVEATGGLVISGAQQRCPHRQAEPVILSTGEQVACVCIACFAPLAAGWIIDQRSTAERVARCAHDDLIDISAFGEYPGSHQICAGCGASNH